MLHLPMPSDEFDGMPMTWVLKLYEYISIRDNAKVALSGQGWS